MVAYWPSLVFQDSDGMMQEILYNKSGGWSQSSLGVRGWNSSGLAEVPLSQNFTNYGVDVFYQRDDQRVIEFSRNSSIGGWSAGMYILFLCMQCYFVKMKLTNSRSRVV
jgi:hypothetical protein